MPGRGSAVGRGCRAGSALPGMGGGGPYRPVPGAVSVRAGSAVSGGRGPEQHTAVRVQHTAVRPASPSAHSPHGLAPGAAAVS